MTDDDDADDDIDFVASLIALRLGDPLLRHARWFATEPDAHEPAIHWLRPDGEAMRIDDWHDAHAHAFACQLAADAASPPRWCLVFNPGAQPARFHLPHGPWRLAADSSGTLAAAGPYAQGDDRMFDVPFRSLLLLRHETNPQETHR